MHKHDTTLPPCLARGAVCTTHCVADPKCAHLPPDDELPPWLGERVRDITHDIYRTAEEAAADDQE